VLCGPVTNGKINTSSSARFFYGFREIEWWATLEFYIFKIKHLGLSCLLLSTY
jgi:hypothetical protein